ncbi:sarcosine oxidase subunit gamma [Cobetia crustatorum]|uniref:Sarcosine oxidase subunit gamma n=1 Tax=Cobetia crustatorum TaxID=553385 RepID=A0A558HUC3_9GAMM|nr:sarcosine oxidase subunit gamma family protein [Cobetia crustatorum]TVU72706.1 sarcosine oxidase subunit gamma [Cobetia crustatorum]
MSDATTLDPQAVTDADAATRSQTSVIDQRPALDVHLQTARSPLAHLFTVRADANAGVVLEEKAFLGHLMLRGDPAQSGFAEAVEVALGLALPLTSSTLNLNDAGVSIQWLAPDEWLIIVPGEEAFAFEQALHEQLSGRYQVVNVSGGQTVVSLSGAQARQVLMKSTPTDVHPRAFPVGRGVPAVFAKATLILRHVSAKEGESEFELVIRRSFADYLGRWLLDASEEFGVCIKA